MNLLKRLIKYIIIFLVVGIICLFLIEYSIALTAIILLIDDLFLVFSIIFCSGDYRLKYLFLGKKFNDQVNDFYKKYPKDSIKNNKLLIKLAKSNYRKNGVAFSENTINLFYSCPENIIDQFVLEHYDVNYANPLMDLYILHDLYYLIPSGSGLYGLFENINEKISYEEYKSIIKKSSIIDEAIKEALLDDSLMKPYQYVNNEKNLSLEEKEILCHFEKEISPLSSLESLIKTNYENYAISYYIRDKLKYNLPQNLISLYFNEKTSERLMVLAQEDGTCFFVKNQFIFDEDIWKDQSYIKKYGYFIEAGQSGLYANLELLENDNKDYFNDFEKINI